MAILVGFSYSYGSTSISSRKIRHMFYDGLCDGRAPFLRVDAQYVLPGGAVRRGEVQLTVEPARAPQRRVHRVETIRRADYNHFSPGNRV